MCLNYFTNKCIRDIILSHNRYTNVIEFGERERKPTYLIILTHNDITPLGSYKNIPMTHVHYAPSLILSGRVISRVARCV